jgi:hypothetical protein
MSNTIKFRLKIHENDKTFINKQNLKNSFRRGFTAQSPIAIEL